MNRVVKTPVVAPVSYAGSNLILVSLIILAMVGLCSFHEYNILPTKWILEIVLFVSCLMCLQPYIRRRPGWLGLIAICYVAINLFLMELFNKSNIYDFLLVYKAYIYIPILMAFLNSGGLNYNFFGKTYKIVLACLLLKYLYLKIFFWGGSIGARPGLYGENNYELMTILILYPLFRLNVSSAARYLIVIAAIVFLSESRSAMLSFVCVYACIYMTRISKRTIFIAAAAIIFFALAVTISILREHGGGLSDIDRYRFMLIWFDELRKFSFLNYMFGAFPITPLSHTACEKLSFYSTLFSYSGNGSCYAVILHSFNMRAIYNYGVVGFVFVMYIVWISLKYSSIAFRDRVAILAVIGVNGLSVSALGSVYCAIALAIVLSSKYNKRTGYKNHERYMRQEIASLEQS